MKKIISLNVYQHYYSDRTIGFLTQTPADIYCLQEVMRTDFELLKKRKNLQGHFISTGKSEAIPGAEFGVAILTTGNLHVEYSGNFGYQNPYLAVPTYCGLIVATLRSADGESYRVATLHGPWTPNGHATLLQLKTLKRLLEILKGYDQLIVLGDFNAPRGGSGWQLIADRYRDNIPESIQTTIDGSLHRAGDLGVVVDGVFSTSSYRVSNVTTTFNISDHCAISAELEVING